MHKFSLMVVLLLLGGCASFGRGVADAFIEERKSNVQRCEIEGFKYPGLKAELENNNKILKVLMIHGVGIHHPGYSRRIQENLANNLGLSVISRLPKNITLLDPKDNKTKIGNLRITYWQNETASQNMLFYELTWSEITTPYKKIIAYDTTEQYSKFRAPFNNMMKEFLDNALPDPLIYIRDPNNLILDSSEQAFCWMLKTSWDSIPNNQALTCKISTAQAIKDLEHENIAFITHSLGSKIFMDALVNDANIITAAAQKSAPGSENNLLIKKLQQKQVTVFMLANQLPLLQIAAPLPQVHNQINSYCSPKGKNYSKRIFKEVNVVAFSDPNDILSYAIPQEFVDEYFDSRICPRVTNVSVNVAPEISAFGIGVVDPVTAHTSYDTSDKVINLITNGTNNFAKDEDINRQCHFIEMKKDNSMK